MVQIRAFFGGEKAEVAHLDKAPGQDVLEEAVDEFPDRQSERLECIIFGILVLEGDLTVLDGKDASDRDGHPEDVRGKILESSFSRTDWLHMANPILGPNGVRYEFEQIGLFEGFPEISSDQPCQGSDVE